MKKRYERPMIEIEGFVANEYVAACYTCMSPYMGANNIYLEETITSQYDNLVNADRWYVSTFPKSTDVSITINGQSYPVVMCDIYENYNSSSKCKEKAPLISNDNIYTNGYRDNVVSKPVYAWISDQKEMRNNTEVYVLHAINMADLNSTTAIS